MQAVHLYLQKVRCSFICQIFHILHYLISQDKRSYDLIIYDGEVSLTIADGSDGYFSAEGYANDHGWIPRIKNYPEVMLSFIFHPTFLLNYEFF